MPALTIAPDAHLHAPPATIARLLVFTGVSIALHVATLASYTPAGTTAAPAGGPVEPPVLHATLLAPDSPVAQPGTVEPPQPAEQQALVGNEPAALQARAGSAVGADVPLPNKWYEAGELDARAEPLTHIPLVYPEELNGTGVVGRVRVLLFIDERGVVRRAQVTASQPEGLFDKAAIKAWEEVRFAPARKNGTAVKSQKLLELEYLPN